MNEENLLKEIGRRLCRERRRQRLTQEKVAEQAGCDRSFYCSVERGKRNITFSTFCRIAFALKQDVAFFLKNMPTPVYMEEAFASTMAAADVEAAEKVPGSGEGGKHM